MHKRRRIRPVYLSLATVLITLVAMSGCAAPGYNDREAMLFEDKLHAEFKKGSFAPSNDQFIEKTGTGIRFSYEYEYGMHFGFQLTSTHDVEGAEYVHVDSNGVELPDITYGGPKSGTIFGILDEKAERVIGRSDRDALTINFDWEVPVSKDGNAPYFRWGFGVGLLNVKNHLSDDFKALLPLSPETGGPLRVKIPSQPMFLLSPSASVRWDFLDYLSLFVEAQLDIASHDLVIDIEGDGDRYGEDSVDYGGFMGFVGIDYSF